MDLVAGGVCAATGFLAAGARAGIKAEGLDVALIGSERPCAAAGVFTRNAFISPCARISRDRVRAGLPVRGVFANSGCANACTGPAGEADIIAIMERTARALGERLPGVDGTVLACQTGVIGRRLTPDRVEDAIDAAASGLSRAGAADAARAIMTTDTRPKECAVEFTVGDRTVRVGGMAKGAGMIAPNMGTMHAFITTDI
ncbi:MAG TPA: bifunctional ornithine acetyltransferase/N-acetylglutamate synthase, partial [Armatimonadota bacterium]|nr:bifunctional ornithine acetyltransferase/N-acetylglutamate synthase [Armatimonadota bacterium]